jgi:anti-anti-sigma factor
MSLEFRSERSDQGVLDVALVGRLDSDSAAGFDEKLSAALAAQISVLVLDLSELEYISSAGIRSLFAARVAMGEKGGRLFVLSPQPAVRKVLDMVRVLEAESIVESAEELDRVLA